MPSGESVHIPFDPTNGMGFQVDPTQVGHQSGISHDHLMGQPSADVAQLASERGGGGDPPKNPPYNPPKPPSRIVRNGQIVSQQQANKIDEAANEEEDQREIKEANHNDSNYRQNKFMRDETGDNTPEKEAMGLNDERYETAERTGNPYSAARTQDTDALLASERGEPEGTEHDSNLAAIPGTGITPGSNMADPKER